MDGYYNLLLTFMDKEVDESFIGPIVHHITVFAKTTHNLMCKFEEYIPEHYDGVPKLNWETEQQLISGKGS